MGIWNFPDFKKKCPICHGKNCAVRHGYYYRLIIDIVNGYFFLILIMRYKCRRVLKPKNQLKDETFSLLPHTLIPYISFTIDSFMIIIMNSLIVKKSTKEIQTLLEESHIDAERIYNFDSRLINQYIDIFKRTYFKLNQYIDKHKIRAGPFIGLGSIGDAIEFIKNYKNGFTDFSIYYYDTEGGFIQNAWFLFGEPYQSYSF